MIDNFTPSSRTKPTHEVIKYKSSSITNLKDEFDTSKFTAIMKNDGMALQFAPEEMRQNKKVVMEAVSQNGLALQFASESLRLDLEVLRAAVSENGVAFEYVPNSIRPYLVLQVWFQNDNFWLLVTLFA